MPDLSIDLVPGGKRSLALRNPVMTASGTFGNGLEYARIFDIQQLGAIVSKAITRKPRKGNVQPQVRASMIPLCPDCAGVMPAGDTRRGN